MKRISFTLVLAFSAIISVFAQTNQAMPPSRTRGNSNAIDFGFSIPAGEFAKTHYGGISLNYLWSNHRFGKFKTLPKKPIGVIATGGIDYYFGKKDTVASFVFRNDSYVYLRAMAGFVVNPFKNANISLMSGPVTGIYKGSPHTGIGVNLLGHYSLNEKIILVPGILYMKHADANALWAILVQAAFSF